MSSYWRQQSYDVMERVLKEGRKAGDPPEVILKSIDNAYPFGPRTNYPYKAWLLERKKFVRALGLEKPLAPTGGDLFQVENE